MRRGEGRHRLVRLREAGREERARLVTPEGREVELTRETWLRLAAVVGRMFPGEGAPARPPRPANNGRRWTPECDASLAAAWKRGETAAALARQLGRSRRAVGLRLLLLGLIEPPVRLPPVVGATGGRADGAPSDGAWAAGRRASGPGAGAVLL